MWKILSCCLLSLGMSGVAVAQQPAPAADAGAVRDALTVQKARAASIQAGLTRQFYQPDHFKLDDLPAYVPETKISGTIRVWTSDLWGHPGFQPALVAAFKKAQPDARIEFVSASPSGAFAGLLTNQADVAIARRMMWVDLLSFQRKFNHDPIVVRGMTGWDVDPPFVIAVHKDNPIAKLSLEQLDGIFGAERNGGWHGTSWDPSVGRGPEKNIRTWGQLGLKGEWANKTIDVFGYNLQYLFAPRFSDDILQSSGKWNEHLTQFTIHADTSGKLVSVDQQMADALGNDRYAIAYYSPMRGINANTRPVPLAMTDGKVVTLTVDTVRDQSYPLYDSMWFYANPHDDGSLDPKVREFLRFILSRDAQTEVARDTTMLPLTKAEIAEQSKALAPR